MHSQSLQINRDWQILRWLWENAIGMICPVIHSSSKIIYLLIWYTCVLNLGYLIYIPLLHSSSSRLDFPKPPLYRNENSSASEMRVSEVFWGYIHFFNLLFFRNWNRHMDTRCFYLIHFFWRRRFTFWFLLFLTLLLFLFICRFFQFRSYYFLPSWWTSFKLEISWRFPIVFAFLGGRGGPFFFRFSVPSSEFFIMKRRME